MVYAYNCTTHDTTGFEPYFLMFGRHPKLPIDLILGEEGDKLDQEKFAKNWERQMREAYQIVRERSLARKQKDINRRKKDGKKILGDLMVGERVLVRNVRERGGPGKIRSHWEQKVYVVKEKKSEVVYTVIGEGEQNETKSRVLHRNMLLPVSQWFMFEKPSKGKRNPKEKVNSDQQAECEDVEDADVEDEEHGEWVAIFPDRQPSVSFPPGGVEVSDMDGNTMSDSVSDVDEENDDATVEYDMDDDDDTVASFSSLDAEQELEDLGQDNEWGDDDNVSGVSEGDGSSTGSQDEEDQDDISTVEYDDVEARNLLDELTRGTDAEDDVTRDDGNAVAPDEEEQQDSTTTTIEYDDEEARNLLEDLTLDIGAENDGTEGDAPHEISDQELVNDVPEGLAEEPGAGQRGREGARIRAPRRVFTYNELGVPTMGVGAVEAENEFVRNANQFPCMVNRNQFAPVTPHAFYNQPNYGASGHAVPNVFYQPNYAVTAVEPMSVSAPVYVIPQHGVDQVPVLTDNWRLTDRQYTDLTENRATANFYPTPLNNPTYRYSYVANQNRQCPSMTHINRYSTSGM